MTIKEFYNWVCERNFEDFNFLIEDEDSIWDKIVSLKPDYTILPLEEVYKQKMNQDYYRICYFNLWEKYLCGGISEEDWSKIEQSKNL